MSDLFNYLHKPIVNMDIFDFNIELLHAHSDILHNIPIIPAGYTMMDFLSYLFNNDVIVIATAIDDYNNGDTVSIEILDTLKIGIKEKIVCLKCVKENMS